MNSEAVIDLDSPASESMTHSVLLNQKGFNPRIKPLDLSYRGSCPRVRALTLLTLDVVAGIIAFVVAYESGDILRNLSVASAYVYADNPSLSSASIVGFVSVALLVGLSALWEHYNRRLTFWSELRDIIKATIYSAALVSLIVFALNVHLSRAWMVCFLSVFVLLLPAGRFLSRICLRRMGAWSKPVVVIGDGPLAFKHAKKACRDPYMGLHITSYVDITNREKLARLATRLTHGVDVSQDTFGAERERPHVVIAVENLDNLKRSKSAFDSVMGSCAAVTFIPPISGIPLYNSQLLRIFKGDVAVLRLHNNLRRKSAKVLKRIIDIVLCFFALIALSPVMLVIAILVKRDGGPMFFGQERIGEGGKKFICLKFRSMDINADEKLRTLLATDMDARNSWEKDHKLRNDPRITSVGNFIRKSSLDELPQFWNVLRGDMSLIGPRPIVEAEVIKYSNDFRYYAEAKPGITGLWQISGRNDTGYKERVALDVWYVRNWSPGLDLVIALKTFPILVMGDGAY